MQRTSIYSATGSGQLPADFEWIDGSDFHTERIDRGSHLYSFSASAPPDAVVMNDATGRELLVLHKVGQTGTKNWQLV